MFSCFGTSSFFSMFPLFSLLVSLPCLLLLVLPSSSSVLLVFLPHSSLLELLVSFHCFHFLFIASFPCLTLLVLLVSLLFFYSMSSKVSFQLSFFVSIAQITPYFSLLLFWTLSRIFLHFSATQANFHSCPTQITRFSQQQLASLCHTSPFFWVLIWCIYMFHGQVLTFAQINRKSKSERKRGENREKQTNKCVFKFWRTVFLHSVTKTILIFKIMYQFTNIFRSLPCCYK